MTETTTYTHRSHSQVGSLRRCGWAYKLARVDGVSRRPSCPAVAGSAFHLASEFIDESIHAGVDLEGDTADLATEAIARSSDYIKEEIAKQEGSGWPTDQWKRFGRATKEKPHGEDIEWFSAVGIPNCVQAYIDWRRATPDLVLYDVPDYGPGIEIPFAVNVGDVEVQGYVDRLWQSTETGTLYEQDLKTGRKPKTDEQLGMYRHALKQQYGVDVQWGGYLYALKSGKASLTLPIDLSHWTEEKLYMVYGVADHLIRSGLFLPNPGEECFLCDVSHACQFARAAI